MSLHIALLRAVNVGGKNLVAMPALRALCEGLGLSGAKTILQSGNLVFDASARPTAELEAQLEEATASRLGLSVDFVVRDAAAWTELLAANPFPEEARRDPAHLVVMCLKRAPTATGVEALRAAVRGSERIAVVGRQAYLVYPDGIGRSRLTTALIEAKLGTRGTGRNWSTLQKLAALAGA